MVQWIELPLTEVVEALAVEEKDEDADLLRLKVKVALQHGIHPVAPKSWGKSPNFHGKKMIFLYLKTGSSMGLG